MEDLEEIEKLSTWYDYFQTAYSELEKELERRKKRELEVYKRVNQMRQYLSSEFNQESKIRMDFNEQHYRYLPSNLKQLLEDPPTKYDIYPKNTNLVSLSGMSLGAIGIMSNHRQSDELYTQNNLLEFLEKFNVEGAAQSLQLSYREDEN